MTAELIETRDPRWARMLERTRHDFYHLPDYVALCAATEHASPRAFYAETSDGAMLVPLLIKDLPADLGAPAAWRDAASPYGYPTPLLTDGLDATTSVRLFEAFGKCAASAGIVSIFIRLHPLLPIDADVLRTAGALVHHGPTVYVDLGVEEEALWRQLRRDYRSAIRKLGSLGFETVVDDWNLEREFERIYRQTMERVSASDEYYFDRQYFCALRRALGGNLHLWAVRAPGGDVAAAGLFTEFCETVQFHLSGTDAKHVRSAPSKLMLYAVMQWARSRGNRYFHLGGGLGAREDSLFRFKAGFSQLRSDFHTLHMIPDKERYRTLIDASGAHPSDDDETSFFPLYRAPRSRDSRSSTSGGERD